MLLAALAAVQQYATYASGGIAMDLMETLKEFLDTGGPNYDAVLRIFVNDGGPLGCYAVQRIAESFNDGYLYGITN